MALTSTKPADRVVAKSHHTADPAVQPFLQPTFDPAAYLNTTLPSLSVARSRPSHNSSVPLAELSTQTQALLIQLNAQTSRLSNTLTQLTDEIIRSGARLAYEVEVLRGETTGVEDALEGKLRSDIEVLAPAKPAEPAIKEDLLDGQEAENGGQKGTQDVLTEPEYLRNLRELSLLRSRLDTVIRIFGEATAWPLAPSETTSSFVSVTAPSDSAELASRETKAKAFADSVRAELQEILATATDSAGLEAAAQRVEELRRLAEVWKGTAEEKARRGFVDGLAGMVEERRKALGKSSVSREPKRAVDMRYGDLSSGDGSGGFLSGLRRMGEGMYID